MIIALLNQKGGAGEVERKRGLAGELRTVDARLAQQGQHLGRSPAIER